MSATEPRLPDGDKSAHSLHRLVRPFQRANTTMWRDRERIRTVLENIRDTADEAWLCLEMDERLEDHLPQASQALTELEAQVRNLWPNGQAQARCPQDFMNANAPESKPADQASPVAACSAHPRYRGARRPTNSCRDCLMLWGLKQYLRRVERLTTAKSSGAELNDSRDNSWATN